MFYYYSYIVTFFVTSILLGFTTVEFIMALKLTSDDHTFVVEDLASIQTCLDDYAKVDIESIKAQMGGQIVELVWLIVFLVAFYLGVIGLLVGMILKHKASKKKEAKKIEEYKSNEEEAEPQFRTSKYRKSMNSSK